MRYGNLSKMVSHTAWTYTYNVPTRLASPRNTLPWVDKKIKKTLNRKQRLYKQAKKNNNWTNNKHFQKEVKRAIRKAEYDYNNIIEEGLKNNGTKPVLRYIKSRKQDNIGVSPLKDTGALHSDSQEKTNTLLRQFQSVFTKDGANDNIPNDLPEFVKSQNTPLCRRLPRVQRNQ